MKEHNFNEYNTCIREVPFKVLNWHLYNINPICNFASKFSESR